MNAARLLLNARRAAGLSQRDLAARAGVPQSTIARIERGNVDPSVGLLDRLLLKCGHSLRSFSFEDGTDRSLIQTYLRLTPEERLDSNTATWEFVMQARKALKSNEL